MPMGYLASVLLTSYFLFSQNRVHVLLVRFDAGLAVGVDADQPAFDVRVASISIWNNWPKRMLVERRQTQIGRRAVVVGIGLVRALRARPSARRAVFCRPAR